MIRVPSLLLLALPALAFAQGALDPANGPRPLMRTLDQIAPAIPCGGTPSRVVVAHAPGTYVLASDLTVSSGHGFFIEADNVTLDLNGFTISSSDPTGTWAAIVIGPGQTNLVIRNGHISGAIAIDSATGAWTGAGFLEGIVCAGAVTNLRVSEVTINGVAKNGIDVAGSVSVDHCVVTNCGGTGILAQIVADSSATACGQTGISCATASNCRGKSIMNTGLGATAGTTNCYGFSVKGTGLSTNSATNCYGESNEGTGLFAETADNCFGKSGAGYGLAGSTATNCSGVTASGGAGMVVSGTATNCRGTSFASGGTAISSAIAISCNSGGGTITAGQKFLGTP